MCGWDWDMVTGADTLYGDTRAIFGTEPGSNHDAVRRLIHPDDLERIERDLADAAGNLRDFDGEFRVVHPDGSIHWIHGRGKFSYQDGKAVRMVGVNVDITEQKNRERGVGEAKADLQAQKTLLETIVDHIPIMLLLHARAGQGALGPSHLGGHARLDPRRQWGRSRAAVVSPSRNIAEDGAAATVESDPR